MIKSMNGSQFFTVTHRSKKSAARLGRINTQHGVVETPAFVAVGTNGTLKALDNVLTDALELSLMFCNTYHLIVQPGPAVIKQAGGLHSFIGRTGPIITDSGGFQVFSLAYGSVYQELKSHGTKQYNNGIIKIDEEGVLFRSYRDGSPICLTPESSIQAQKDFGGDIIVAFDELPAYHVTSHALRASLERTHRWEKRSLDEHIKNRQNQALYAVIHGGIDSQLRQRSAQYLTALDFDGYAIGGSVGKNRTEMLTMLTQLMPHLTSKITPVHLLGIGDVASLEHCIALGIDTFDSSYPTRCARHGLLLTSQGPCKILHAVHHTNNQPIDATCACYTCQHYSAAYLHHLFKAHELSAYSLASLHNVHYMIQLFKHYRQAILNNEL